MPSKHMIVLVRSAAVSFGPTVCAVPTPIAPPPETARLPAAGRYAFIGLSKIRKTSAMDGVPLAARRDDLKCGVAAIDLGTGRAIGLLEFQTAVEEIFDVRLSPGLRFPEVVGFQ